MAASFVNGCGVEARASGEEGKMSVGLWERSNIIYIILQLGRGGVGVFLGLCMKNVRRGRGRVLYLSYITLLHFCSTKNFSLI